MGKKLSEMSLEELWQLFPIILTKHQEDWKEWYLEEERLLKNILPQVEKISHIGSTAIPAIWAKPIIDILVEVPKESNLLDYIWLYNPSFHKWSKHVVKVGFWHFFEKIEKP